MLGERSGNAPNIPLDGRPAMAPCAKANEGAPPPEAPPLTSLISHLPFVQFVRLSSTRRFCARPAGVALSATGTLEPYPLAVRRAAATPFDTR